MPTDPQLAPDLMETVRTSMIQYAVIGLILFVYFAFMLAIIARKTGTRGSWMAWIPIANLVLMCRIAKKSMVWVILLLIPFVNLIAVVYVWAGIARARGYAGLVGGLIIVPALGLLVPPYLAFGSPTQHESSSQPPPSRRAERGQSTSARPDICPNCGTPFDPGDAFCGECGQKRVPVNDPHTSRDREPIPVQPRKKSSGTGVFMALILIVLLSAGGWWLYQNGLPFATDLDLANLFGRDDSLGTDPNDGTIVDDNMIPPGDTTLYIFEDDLDDDYVVDEYLDDEFLDDEYQDDEFLDDDNQNFDILELLAQAETDEELKDELDQLLDVIATGPPELDFMHLNRSYPVAACMTRGRDALDRLGMTINESGDWWLLGRNPIFTTYLACINRGANSTLLNVTSAGPPGFGAETTGEQIAAAIDDPTAQFDSQPELDMVVTGLAPEVHFWYLQQPWTMAQCLQRADAALQTLGMPINQRTEWWILGSNDLYTAYVSCLDIGNGTVSINTTIAGSIGSGSEAQRDRLVKLLE